MTDASDAAPPLAVDAEELNRCVACGLCLPACPTWRVTGLEMASPRGRIAAMRAVQWDGAPLDAAFASMMDECVQCRGCEPVCPAFVPFGALMEGARQALVVRGPGRLRRRAEGLALRWVVARRSVLVALSWLAYVLQRLRLVPKRLGMPRLNARDLRRPIRSSVDPGEPVALFTGCVMDAWMRPTHRSAVRVIEAAGGAVTAGVRGWDCCGALAAHAGHLDEARRLARRVIAAAPDEGPIVVDSAGCGAAMKSYGELLGTAAAADFSARVRDVHEWLEGREIEGLTATGQRVVVQDPCHLAHVQRSEASVHAVLARAYEVVAVGDGGLCCGAGGSYALLQPALSRAIRDRKLEALGRAGGREATIASANPGCLMHLAAGGVDVRHPVDLLADALEE